MNDQTTAAAAPQQDQPKPAKPRNLPALASGGHVMAIVPQDFESAYRIAKAVHASQLAPYGIDTPEKAMICILHGLEIGLPPMQALQSIAVINGKPSIYGDAALAIVRASKQMEGFKEWIAGEGDNMTAYCRTKRIGEEPIEAEFSVADAKTAGLWNKTGRNGQPTPWQTHPKRMLKFRARGFAFRDAYTDILKGLKFTEEVQDYTNGDTSEEPPAPPPVHREESPPEPNNVIEGEVIIRQEQTAQAEKPVEKAAEQPAQAEREPTMADLYERDGGPPAVAEETIVWEDDGPPDPNVTAPAATTTIASNPATTDPMDIPTNLDQRGRTPQTDRMKSSLLRDLGTLDYPSDYVTWFDGARYDIAGLPKADKHDLEQALFSRLKSKLIGMIKLLEDADGFQTFATDARDAINILPVGDQADVRSAFSRRQEAAFKEGG